MTSDETGRGEWSVPQELLDALQYAFGNIRGRGLFAKGVFLEGRFVPSSTARQLCSAKLFVHEEAHVLARFSNFAGSPRLADTSPLARPHGFALKLTVPHEPELDVVSHSFDGFPSRTAAEFRNLLVAMGLSPQHLPSPTAFERYLHTHPTAQEFFANQRPPPESYATLTYHGVNAFKMTNAGGEQRHVRYRFVPRAGECNLTPEAATAKGRHYLSKELRNRLRASPIEFDWLVQIAESGDPIEDPSIRWPRDRNLELLGTVTLTQISQKQSELDRKTLFMPANLPDGICAADPMLPIRNAAYPLSYRRRQ